MRVLGIETSCDETAAAIIDGSATQGHRILSEIVLSQLDEHRAYGGVVPEIAARAHLDHVDSVVKTAMERWGGCFKDLDAVAVTSGPGLIGGVIVGMMTAKAIALVHQRPFIAVNHLEGHALSPRLSDDVPFPYLLLLISGGHCQILVVEDVGRYVQLGTTRDDAVGESFDKVAKMLGLGYPGGPAVEKAAFLGCSSRFSFPRPLKGQPGCDFSFSGLKTHVRQVVAKLPPGPLSDSDRFDIAASFQAAVAETLSDRVRRAVCVFRDRWPTGCHMVVAGGVAANKAVRVRLQQVAWDNQLHFVAPPVCWCTDNAAMIAWAGVERLKRGYLDGLDFKPRPRWPLETLHSRQD